MITSLKDGFSRDNFDSSIETPQYDDDDQLVHLNITTTILLRAAASDLPKLIRSPQGWSSRTSTELHQQL